MTRSAVAILGNCYFDEIYNIDTYPNPDDKILASDLLIILGGSATNTSCGLVDLGIEANLFTVIGDDEDAYRLFKQLRQNGIQTQYINHVVGKSGRTIILLDKKKTSTKIGYQGVCSDMSETILFEGLANPKFQHVHLASTGLRTIQKALEYKKDQTYSLDFGAKTQKASTEELLEVLSQLDYVFLNRDIFKRLFKTTIDNLAGVEEPCDLIITAGKDGIYAKIDGEIYHQDIVEVDVTDTTGAGDAVSAAVIYSYLHDLPPQTMLEVAVTAASIKIKTFGGSNGHATVSELSHIWDREE